jgi:hypothetical protein
MIWLTLLAAFLSQAPIESLREMDRALYEVKRDVLELSKDFVDLEEEHDEDIEAVRSEIPEAMDLTDIATLLASLAAVLGVGGKTYMDSRKKGG